MSRSQLPLNALRAFEAAARHASFTHAAEELHVTQAAVSHQVKALEEKLGVALFVRRPRGLEIVSCPSCGRAQVDVYKLANEVSAGLEGLDVPLRVAVMGCVVNGPGEAREADLGVASGNGKGQIFVKGEVIKTVPESQIVETLIEEAMRLAEQQRGTEDDAAGSPVVTVS